MICNGYVGLLMRWLVSRPVVLGLAFAITGQTWILPAAAQKTPDKKSPSKPVAESRPTALERKWTQQARTLLDGVLATAYRVEPIEWRCLVEVEAGTLL